jgi:hypothetical protein
VLCSLRKAGGSGTDLNFDGSYFQVVVLPGLVSPKLPLAKAITGAAGDYKPEKTETMEMAGMMEVGMVAVGGRGGAGQRQSSMESYVVPTKKLLDARGIELFQ